VILRNIYQELVQWKQAKVRKPLILRGARQVGKTHLLKTFAAQEYAEHVYLNFETDPKLESLFADDLSPSTIINNISLHLERDFDLKDTLFIFDEIQEAPTALNSLKYFAEQAPEVAVAAAGSLLGIKLRHSKGFPVGKVEFLDLYPLSFTEFLTAVGKTKLSSLLTELADLNPLPEALHEECLSWLKKYFFIGGMPEAVATFVATENFSQVRKVQQALLDAYLLDFAKHAPKEQVARISQIWESIPLQLAKENKKFIFSALSKSARGREYETAIQWLSDAGLIYRSYAINKPQLPLAAYCKQNIFKIFLIDVGLLASMSRLPTKALTIDGNIFAEFYGAFTKNFVAQQLVNQHYPLYYWASEGAAELDFVLEEEGDIIPLEAKAGVSRQKKSLLLYKEKYAPSCLLRSSLLNLKHDGAITNLPLYLMDQAKRLLKRF